MKRAFLFGATIATALVAGGSTLAEGPETQKMRAMIRGIEFITQNSSLEYAGQALPDLAVVTEDELQLLFNASETHASALEYDHSFGLVAAFYDRSTNKIFLSDESAIAGPSLFHELVHFLQDVNDKSDMFTSHRACLEAEAYELQAIWQTVQGIDHASRPNYGFVMTLYGACNDADFSWIDSANLNADKCGGADTYCGQFKE